MLEGTRIVGGKISAYRKRGVFVWAPWVEEWLRRTDTVYRINCNRKNEVNLRKITRCIIPAAGLGTSSARLLPVEPEFQENLEKIMPQSKRNPFRTECGRIGNPGGSR